MTVLDPKNSPPDLGDASANPIRAPTYIRAFMVDGEPFPTTDMVRPWGEGRGGKVAECVRKALLLPEHMSH